MQLIQTRNRSAWLCAISFAAGIVLALTFVTIRSSNNSKSPEIFSKNIKEVGISFIRSLDIEYAVPVIRTILFDETGEVLADPDVGIKAAIAVGIPVMDSAKLASLKTSDMHVMAPLPEGYPWPKIPMAGCVFKVNSQTGNSPDLFAAFWEHEKEICLMRCNALSDRVFVLSGSVYYLDKKLEPVFDQLFPKIIFNINNP